MLRARAVNFAFVGMVVAALYASVPVCARAAQAAPDAAARTGLYQTHFDRTSPLADYGEVLQRCLASAVYAAYVASHGAPSGQTIDPAKETWQVYVPAAYDGHRAYGVLVWVEPFDTLRFPSGWQRVLDEHRLIYVAAAQSGNDQDVYARRIPLALTGLANVEARYRTDPNRIYIGGFSGGAGTASLIAAAYPQMFTGGIFVATSLNFGGQHVPVPPAPRLARMQANGRYVFLVGSDDPVNEVITTRAASSYRAYCILRVKNVTMWNKGHTNAGPAYLDYALNYLDSNPVVSAARQANCERSLKTDSAR
ncbi:MAG: PHB depolymerase family esterase [Gammaproteobacteria bacterium]